jgi:hypothetical protein
MTKIILIDPRKEIVVNIMDVFDNESVKRINDFIKVKTSEYGELDRVLINAGRVDVMNPKDGIPIPFQVAKRS